MRNFFATSAPKDKKEIFTICASKPTMIFTKSRFVKRLMVTDMRRILRIGTNMKIS